MTRLSCWLLPTCLLLVPPFGLSAAEPAAPAADSETPDDGGPASNPVQKLVEARKYADAILEVKTMRAKAGKPLVDAESEFWAARAENGLKSREAARERFLAIARAYPEHERGSQAAIEATTVRLSEISTTAKTAAEKKMAAECAAELEATAKRLAGKPDVATRAWYVAGNAWRTCGENEKALADYELARAGTGPDYPAKGTYMVGILKARLFDVSGAGAMFTDCIKRFPDSSSAEKCRKGLARINMVGTPAPAITVETWLNSAPVDPASLKGNVTLVWFFATWCPHCKAAMPEIAGLVDQYRGKPFKVVGITANMKEQTTESAKQFVADPQWKFNYPAAVDKGGTSTDAWNALGIPAAILVDKTGVIRWSDHPVYLDAEMIDRLLAE